MIRYIDEAQDNLIIDAPGRPFLDITNIFS